MNGTARPSSIKIEPTSRPLDLSVPQSRAVIAGEGPLGGFGTGATDVDEIEVACPDQVTQSAGGLGPKVGLGGADKLSWEPLQGLDALRTTWPCPCISWNSI
jgi:hypothetical protein